MVNLTLGDLVGRATAGLPHSRPSASTACSTNRALGNPLPGGPDTAAWGDWSKEIVLITGGSSGLGRLVVDEFARRGITVVVLDVRDPVAAFPGSVGFYKVDPTDDDAVDAVADRVRTNVGDPTVLIKNAGTDHGRTLLDATPGKSAASSASTPLRP
ncbi:NAD(P)-binding domain protein [Niveomyces insectorum RCEF 264]|uniref:NAD(P)-binding domain protein n=1 Tax=Niveomyces insectorum RCEF 264 TaxID=1081102 RepID=A0A167Y5M9_9HYPO|nr:NAD(P)-binding domain protein [Niveomyces insectorum RCEF 264]